MRPPWEISATVRGVRNAVSQVDPCRLCPKSPRGKDPGRYLDAYVTPSLTVARAFLNGASAQEAVEVLREALEALYPDRRISRRAMCRLRREWRGGWTDEAVEWHTARIEAMFEGS